MTEYDLSLFGIILLMIAAILFRKSRKIENSFDVQLLSRETQILLSILFAIFGLAMILYNFGFHVDRSPFGKKF